MREPIVELRRSISSGLDPLLERVRVGTRRREVRVALIVALLAALLVYGAVDSDIRVDVAASTEVLILLALGLNIVVGYAGLLDLGYAAFFAIGAYSLAMLASPQFSFHRTFSSPLVSWGSNGIHVNFFLMIPLAALIAAFSGVLFGAPTLRLRGDYLAIVTLGFGEIVPQVIKNLGPDNSLGLPNLTNGVNRIAGIDTPPDIQLFGFHWTFSGNSSRPWYYLGLIIVVVSVIAIYSLRNSRLGRAWAAIREDEVAAAHMGINITRTRLLAFGLGAAFSGFGGLLEAARITSVDASQFDFSISIKILVMVILGGMGSIPGAIVGAIVISYLDLSWLFWINDHIHSLGQNLHSGPGPIGAFGTWMANLNLVTARPLIFGIILVGIMLLRPQGLLPSSTRAHELQPETDSVLAEENQQLYTARAE